MCECVSEDRDGNIICPNPNLAMVCIKQGYWYDEAKKITIPCPIANCNYMNGRCPKNVLLPPATVKSPTLMMSAGTEEGSTFAQNVKMAIPSITELFDVLLQTPALL